MNYGEIKTAILNRSHRADLSAKVGEFVALAESEYNARTGSAYELGPADTSHNALSDGHPTVYIYGGLRQLALYTVDDAALGKYTQLFDRAVSEAHYAETKDSGILDEAAGVDAAIVAIAPHNILTDT